MATKEEQINSIAQELEKIKSNIVTTGIQDNSGTNLLSPTINSDTLSQQNPIQLPTQPDNTSAWTNAMNVGNASVEASKTDNTADNMRSLFDEYTGLSSKLNTDKTSSVDLFNKASEMAGYTPEAKNKAVADQQKLDALNAQLTGLTNAGTAENLALESGGGAGGGTKSFLSGQQAEVSRQTAIKALPLQASIQAQQAIVTGNTNLLKNAKESMDTYYSLLSTDATNEYNYKKSLLDATYNFMTAEQKSKADALAKQEDRNFTLQTNNTKQASDLASRALESGQSDLMSEILKLDPTSKTFQNDIATLSSQIKETPEAILDRQLKQLQVAKAQRDLGGGGGETLSIDDAKKYNELYPNAGIKVGDTVAEANRKAGVGGTTGKTSQDSLDQLNFLIKTAGEATNLSGASGLGLIDRISGVVIGSSKYNQLDAKVNTLKTNVLSLMTDPNVKKFFGPQMSNADVELMSSAGTTLNTEKNTPAQMVDEITRLTNLFTRMKDSVAKGVSEDYLNNATSVIKSTAVDSIFTNAGYKYK